MIRIAPIAINYAIRGFISAMSYSLAPGFDSQDDIDDSKEKQFTDKVNEKLQNIIAEMRVKMTMFYITP